MGVKGGGGKSTVLRATGLFRVSLVIVSEELIVGSARPAVPSPERHLTMGRHILSEEVVVVEPQVFRYQVPDNDRSKNLTPSAVLTAWRRTCNW